MPSTPLYAAPGKRLGAFIVDSVILATFAFVNYMTALALLPTLDTNGKFELSDAVIIFWSVLGMTLIEGMGYFVLTAGKTGMTFGKKVFRIKIVRTDGKPINRPTIFFRYLFFALYQIPYLGFILYLISGLLVFFDSKKQTLHDRVMKTEVVQAV